MGEVKNIAVFSGIFHPESGGPATYLYKLCNSLTNNGYKIKLLAYGEKNKYTYPYSVTRISRKYPVPLRLLIYFIKVLQIASNADLVFISDYGFPVVLANIFLRKRTIIKIVGDFAWEKSIRDNLTSDNIDDFQVKRQCLRAEFLKKLQHFYVSRAGSIVVPSQYLKKIVLGWGIPAKKILVVYNAMEIQGSKINKIFNKKTSSLLTVARLVPWKGIDKVMKVIPEIRRKVTNIEYLVVGDGPDLNRLKQLAIKYSVNSSVKFMGKLTNNEVLTQMKKADLFILYSGYEGLPHVVLEAMSVGLPSLVSNKGGNPEVIALGKCGRVCQSDSALAVDIIKSLQAPIQIKHIPPVFKWENLVKQMEQLFNAN